MIFFNILCEITFFDRKILVIRNFYVEIRVTRNVKLTEHFFNEFVEIEFIVCEFDDC